MTAAQMVSTPTVEDVAVLVGDPSLVDSTTEAPLRAVVALASSYTRGEGFDPANAKVAEDLHAVIVAATARLVANPEQDKRIQSGDFSVVPTVGWTLVETAVLNRYRRRAL